MSRFSLGLITAIVASLLAVEHAAAGGCGFALRPFGSCGNAYSYAQPYYPQPAYYAQPACSCGAAQPVPMYVVNQGPYYSGPNATDYSNPLYYGPRPVRAYPYVAGGYHRWHGYHRHGYHRTGLYRPYRAYPVRRYY